MVLNLWIIHISGALLPLTCDIKVQISLQVYLSAMDDSFKSHWAILIELISDHFHTVRNEASY